MSTLFETEMKGEKVSQLEFHSPGLLVTSTMSKQEMKFFSIIEHQR